MLSLLFAILTIEAMRCDALRVPKKWAISGCLEKGTDWAYLAILSKNDQIMTKNGIFEQKMTKKLGNNIRSNFRQIVLPIHFSGQGQPGVKVQK